MKNLIQEIVTIYILLIVVLVLTFSLIRENQTLDYKKGLEVGYSSGFSECAVAQNEFIQQRYINKI
jgi:hypothetical protein